MPETLSTLEQIIALSAPDMAKVNHCIEESLKSDVVLINQISHYIISSGGKRLRPMLLTLCAHACEYQGQDHIPLAAIIEFIHTATLLHDDVVDESELRRFSVLPQFPDDGGPGFNAHHGSIGRDNKHHR